MKKILALVACLSLVASLAVGGSIAYLTDRASEVNVFTLGEVNIEIEEEFEDNTLVPGKPVEKRVHIKNIGDNDAWVWLNVQVEPANMKDYIHLEFGDEGAGWILHEDDDHTNLYTLQVGKNEYAMDGLVNVILDSGIYADEGGGLFMPKDGNQGDHLCNINDLKVIVNAYAIQSEGIDTVEKAYEFYVGQWGVDGGLENNNGAKVETTEVADIAALTEAMLEGEDGAYLYTGGNLEIPSVKDAEYGYEKGFEIKGNKQIYLEDGAKLTFADGAYLKVDAGNELGLYNAKIESNKQIATVYGKLTLGEGTTIENYGDNEANSSVINVWGESAEIVLDGVVIADNVITKNFNLICVSDGARMIIKDGTEIKGNKMNFRVTSQSSMFKVHNATAIMEGGLIADNEFNTIQLITVSNGGKFIVSGGEISGNIGTNSSGKKLFLVTGANGDGVESSLEINGCLINGNTIDGVY